jgi:hypothetical protein
MSDEVVEPVVEEEKDELIDIDSMSDEDFMKLDPSQMQEVPAVEVEEPVVDPELETDNDEEVPPAEPVAEEPPVVEEPAVAEEVVEEEPPVESANPDPLKAVEAPKTDKDKPAAADKAEGTAEKTPAAEEVDVNAATDFFKKVSAPFKADGREVTIKSPEDAIRLMQMGVNYSRRMEEMKPLRAQDQMLKDNGLNDAAKLNFLIDLSKGNPAAIKQLLLDHKIDPVDIDTTDTATPYKATNYEGDPKDIAFDDAIKTTMAAEGGRELVADINKEWDPVSIEALRDQPSIFQNILAQKSSGVYSKIKTELEYQRTMGFLTDVPFLQAYHQVGEAMQKHGVFDTKPEAQPAKVVVGTGTRKPAPKPTTEQATPNVSSATPPRSVPSNGGGQPEIDYATLSDEDFMKLAPPG